MEAIISGQTGVAILVEGGEISSIHIDAPEQTVPRRGEDVNYLLRDASDIETIEDSTSEQIIQRLGFARDREEGLHLGLMVLDADLSDEIRQEAAEGLNGLLILEGIVEGLENIFYAKKLPDVADLKGAIDYCELKHAERAGIFYLRLQYRQSYILAVRRQWESIPEKYFGA